MRDKILSKQNFVKKSMNLSSYDLLKKIFIRFVWPQYKKLWGAFFCLLLVALCTAASVHYLQPVLDFIFVEKREDYLYFLGGIGLLIFLIKGAASYGASILMESIGYTIAVGFKDWIYGHLLYVDLQKIKGYTTSKILAHIISDVEVVRASVLNTTHDMVKDSLSVIGLLGVLFYKETLLSVIALIFLPMVIVPLSVLGRRMRKTAYNTQEAMGKIYAFLQESFQNISVIRAYGLEKQEEGKFHTLLEKIFQEYLRAAKIRAIVHPLMESLGGVVVVLVVLYGGSQVMMGKSTTGAFISFIAGLLFLYKPLKNLVYLNTRLQEGLSAAGRIFGILDWPLEESFQKCKTPMNSNGNMDLNSDQKLKRPAYGEGQKTTESFLNNGTPIENADHDNILQVQGQCPGENSFNDQCRGQYGEPQTQSQRERFFSDLKGYSLSVNRGSRDVIEPDRQGISLRNICFSYAQDLQKTEHSSKGKVDYFQKQAQETLGVEEEANKKSTHEEKLKNKMLELEEEPLDNENLSNSLSESFLEKEEFCKKSLFSGLSFTIPWGSKVALVGPSGSGKTTVFGLLLGFYRPFRGNIFFGEVDSKYLPLDFMRRHISFVGQDSALFDRSIKDNILFGNPQASMEEIEEAAFLAHAHEFIVKLPRRYDTTIGEMGNLLSGGQKQRISIARAFLKDAPILLLDEATSALDAQSEFHIQSALEDLTRHRTTLMIAHRFSSLQKAEKIFVLDHGQLVEEGSHSDLIEKNGIYANLHHLQKI